MKDAAFAMCLPLTQLDTTHVPSHSEAQLKAQGRSRESGGGAVYIIDSNTNGN